MHDIICCSILIIPTIIMIVCLIIMGREINSTEIDIEKYFKRKKKAEKQQKKLKIYDYKNGGKR